MLLSKYSPVNMAAWHDSGRSLNIGLHLALLRSIQELAGQRLFSLRM